MLLVITKVISSMGWYSTSIRATILGSTVRGAVSQCKRNGEGVERAQAWRTNHAETGVGMEEEVEVGVKVDLRTWRTSTARKNGRRRPRSMFSEGREGLHAHHQSRSYASVNGTQMEHKCNTNGTQTF